VTWIEFGDDGVTISARLAPQLDQRIDPAKLPESIHSRYGTLVRDDLRPATVEAARAAAGR